MFKKFVRFDDWGVLIFPHTDKQVRILTNTGRFNELEARVAHYKQFSRIKGKILGVVKLKWIYILYLKPRRRR